MMIDTQAPPSDENISTRQSDLAILIQFRKRFHKCFSVTSYLRKILQAKMKRPLAEKIVSFARQNLAT
jgi:predicted nucleotidyltransferase